MPGAGDAAPRRQPTPPRPASPSHGIAMTIVGLVLALWSTTGAMTSYMTAAQPRLRPQGQPHLPQEAPDRARDGRLHRRRLPARRRAALIFGPHDREVRRQRRSALERVVSYVWWSRAVADPDRRTARGVRDAALARPGRRAAALAFITPGARRRRRASGSSSSGRVRGLHVEVRLLQQDLGVALGGDHHAHVALAHEPRSPLRRRAERRDRRPPGSPPRRLAGAHVVVPTTKRRGHTGLLVEASDVRRDEDACIPRYSIPVR